MPAIISSIIAFFASDLALAQAANQQGPSTVEMLVMPAGFLLIMYFFMIRPQQKRAKEHQAFLPSADLAPERAPSLRQLLSADLMQHPIRPRGTSTAIVNVVRMQVLPLADGLADSDLANLALDRLARYAAAR